MSAEPPPVPQTGGSPNLTPGAALDPETGGTTLRTEEELNAPTPLTLRLLGVVFVATLLPWVGAKVGCNLRDAPTRPPLAVATEVLAKQPKSAALELQQRAATYQYRQAAELAKGEAARELLAADERCVAEPRPCEERRAQSAQIFTRAVLVSRGPGAAYVRAQTQMGEQIERFVMRLEPEAGRWYVVSRAPFGGNLNDPVLPEEVVSPIMIRQVSDPPGSSHQSSPHGVMASEPAPGAAPPAPGAAPPAPPANPVP